VRVSTPKVRDSSVATPALAGGARENALSERHGIFDIGPSNTGKGANVSTFTPFLQSLIVS
jgi:hypothetical protein